LPALYRELLSELCPDLIVPFEHHPGESAHHIMPVVLPNGIDRLHFMEAMKEQGVQTSVHYPPIHLFSSFKEVPRQSGSLIHAEELGKREVTLPLYPTLTDEQVKIVAGAVQKALTR